MTPTPMQDGHRAYVCATWANSQRYGLRTSVAFRLVNKIVDASRVVVMAEGPTVHAWACGFDGVLHYAYVPPELRRGGMAKKLIAAVVDETGSIPVSHPWPWPSTCYKFDVRNLLELWARS